MIDEGGSSNLSALPNNNWIDGRIGSGCHRKVTRLEVRILPNPVRDMLQNSSSGKYQIAGYIVAIPCKRFTIDAGVYMEQTGRSREEGLNLP